MIAGAQTVVLTTTRKSTCSTSDTELGSIVLVECKEVEKSPNNTVV
jgi:hypothetical protein